MKPYRANERIRASQVRVIGADGSQLGVMAPSEALSLARGQGLDLVEVASQVSPPVCRILDFNKFRYAEDRRDREAKKKHRMAKIKEAKFRPRIEAHDYHVKLEMLKRFLIRGDQVKVTMVYRGREVTHTELGRRVLERLVEDLKPLSRVDRAPTLDGRFMTMVFGPDREKIRQWERQEARARAATTAASVSSAQPTTPLTSAATPPPTTPLEAAARSGGQAVSRRDAASSGGISAEGSASSSGEPPHDSQPPRSDCGSHHE